MASTETATQISREALEQLSQPELYKLYRKLNLLDQSNQQRRQEVYLENAHSGQIDFHQASARIRLFLGGNRSGKSTALVNEFIYNALGNHPFKRVRTPNKSVLIANDFENAINDVIYPKFEEWTPPGAIRKTETNQSGVVKKIIFKNGSIIDFKSHDQSPKIFESSDYDLAGFDEPPPEKIWKAVWRGLTDREGQAVFSLTPISEPWMYELYERAKLSDNNDYWARVVNSYDNVVNIGEGDEAAGRRRLQAFERELSEEERVARIEGQFLHMVGRVFKDWDRAHHLIAPFPWPFDWPIYEAIDPHPRKPWAISWLGVSKSNKKVLLRSELIDDTVEVVGQEILRVRQELEIEHGRNPRIAGIYIDNYAAADSMVKDKRPIKDMLQDIIGPRHGGTPILCWPKGVDQKITVMKNWLKVRETKYGPQAEFVAFDTHENVRFLYEIEHYVWDRYRGGRKTGPKDKPLKENDDILDTIMGLCLCNIDFQQNTPRPIRIARDISSYTGGRS